eukprot:9014465-Pyramimonas_sp.AAC.1
MGRRSGPQRPEDVPKGPRRTPKKAVFQSENTRGATCHGPLISQSSTRRHADRCAGKGAGLAADTYTLTC